MFKKIIKSLIGALFLLNLSIASYPYISKNADLTVKDKNVTNNISSNSSKVDVHRNVRTNSNPVISNVFFKINFH